MGRAEPRMWWSCRAGAAGPMIALLAALCAVPAAGQEAAAPSAWLAAALKDPARAPRVLTALRATKDRDLLPLLTALAGSGNRDHRLFAVSALAEIMGKEAAPHLHKVLRSDPANVVRSEAMIFLLDLKAISAEQLEATLSVGDEGLQSLAARGLVEMGRGESVGPTLGRLTQSKDLATSCMARVSLLGLNDQTQLASLRKIVGAGETPDAVVGLVMELVAEGEVVAALPVAEDVINSTRSVRVRMLAHKARAAITRNGADLLAHVIGESNSSVFAVRLLRVLADRRDGKPHLTALKGSPDASVAALSAFELARPAGGPAAAAATAAAMRLRHPIVVFYVLTRAKEDIDARGAGASFYTEALLAFARSVPASTARMGPDHIRAAQAVTLLAEMSTPEALAGIRKILEGPHSAVKRAAAAGLLRSNNKAVCDLARPLLNSPFPELSADAMLTLGRHGDPGARAPLQRVVAEAERHSDPMVALACWYLLGLDGQTRSVAGALAAAIK